MEVYRILKSTSWYLLCFCFKFNLVSSEDYCYTKDNNSYANFGTKTAYEHIYGKDVYIIPGCKIIYIWALMRHGTRYGPTELHNAAKNMSIIRDQIVENHEIHKRGKLCEDDLQNLKKWTDQWTDKICNELTPQGVNDMKGIAGRLKEKLGTHFDFFPSQFETQTTNKRRCQQSSMVFTNELFKTSYTDLVGNNITINDEFLRVMEQLAPIHEELKKYRASKYMEKVINEVTSRLGYESRLSFEFVSTLHSFCIYENAWFVDSKPGFCAAFTPEHLKILEYDQDLYYYYGYGYQNETAKKLSCPIVQDLLTKLTSASHTPENNSKESGVFYVTHAETLLPTFALLELVKIDLPLTHDNYERQSERSYKSSLMCPFAANLIAILYKCTDELKIVFYQNEKVIKFPDCEDKIICSMKKFQKLLSQKIAKDCFHNNSSSKTWSVRDFFTIWYMAILIVYFIE